MKSGFDAARARSKGQRDGNGARTGAAPGEMAQALLDNLRYRQAKLPQHATRNDWYMALAYTVRDRMLDHYITTVDAITGPSPAKVVAYLSAEFLTGPHLGNSLVNLGLWDAAKEAVASVGQDLADAARARGGTRPRQRRPGTPGRLLHGFAGDAQRAGDRLRHPLRVRHLRSGDPRRLAGRADRQVAALRQPLGDRPVGDQLRRAVRRPHRLVPGRARRAPGALGAGPRREGRRLRHARARLPRPVDQPAAAVEGGSHRVVRLRRVQRRRLLRRGRREGRVGDDLQGALSERRARGRQAAAAAAAVLLRLLLAAGHDPPPPAARQAARRSRRVVGGSAQRHPSRRSPSPS